MLSALLVVFAAANAAVVLPAVLQATSSKTSIVGPDGSTIIAAAPEESLLADGTTGYAAAAYPAPITYPAFWAPRAALAYRAPPAVAYIAPDSAFEWPYIPESFEQFFDDGFYKLENK